jgi:hypothetical protein
MLRHMDQSVPTLASGLPAAAAWRHLATREGFEILFATATGDGHRFEGHSTGLEAGEAWSVGYSLMLDREWRNRAARVAGLSASGERSALLEGDGNGEWLLDGEPAPELDGCLEVDLEASAFTNAFPVRRLGLAVGERAEAPAAWVRVPDLRVERLEQAYTRLPDEGERSRYDYEAPTLGFRAVITYDPDGLVRDYPGIAERVA